MDIKHIFSEHQAMTYMCKYSSKTEDQHSQAMKQAAKEAFEDNINHRKNIKKIAKVYLSS